MVSSRQLVVAMAETCRELLRKSGSGDTTLPKQLRSHHLLWMCNQLERHAEEWSEIKLHRWLGFLQAGLMANRMLDFEGVKAMFDIIKKTAPVTGDEQDLIDHLDPTISFEVDMGGEG